MKDYRKELSTKLFKSKLFWRLLFPTLLIAIGSIYGNIELYKSHKKMKFFNDSLKYLHDAYPKIGVNEIVHIFERPESDPKAHKFISEKIKKYEGLWWLKE
jgi:hypothetical protein